MKRILSICVIFILVRSYSGTAQTEDNSQNQFYSFVSEKIQKVKTWKLTDYTHRWFESENVIGFQYEKNYSLDRIRQHIHWIQLRSLIINNCNFYVLVYEKTGTKKNKDLEQKSKIRTCLNMHFFIIADSQFQFIQKELKIKPEKIFFIESNMHGYFETNRKEFVPNKEVNENLLKENILNSINNPDTLSLCLPFNIDIVENTKVVNFRIPEPYFWSKKKISYGFFEIPLDEIKKILDK